jgi:hypothetical protein
MKKTFSLLLTVSLCLPVLADQDMFVEEPQQPTYAEKIDIHAHKHGTVSEDERMAMMGNFVIAAISGVALTKGQARLGMSTAVHGALQVSNALWHMGSITKNEVLHDLSVRTLLASGATAIAGLPQVSTLAAMTPYIGEGLKNGAGYTTGLLTVSAYKAAEIATKKVCDTLSDWNLSVCATF